MQRSRLALLSICSVFLLAMVCTGLPSAQAAEQPQQAIFRGASTAVRFDVSPPLRSIPPQPVKPGQDRDEFEERLSGLEGPLGPQDVDARMQSRVGSGEIPAPLVSFNGPPNVSGVAPPDPVGDVGPSHYVAMSNLSYQIFNKTGTSLLGPALTNTLWAGFGGACQAENSGDPVVIYDQLDDRWILTQFTSAGPTYFNCVAISTTGDPTGTYFRYAFSTGSNFPDYPKYGMWPDALYISTREFAGASFAGVGAYAVKRSDLVAGIPAAQVISFLVPPGATAYNIGDGLLPSDLDGATLPPAGSPNFFIGSMDNGGPYAAPGDNLVLWKFDVDFAVPPNSTFTLANTIPIGAYDTMLSVCAGRACVPQPGTANRIDHLGYRQRPLHRAAYRNFGSHESIVTNQSVEGSVGMSGIRWWEIRSPNVTPVIFQEGTYNPGATDSIHRWMGSIAMDFVGNMALGYSASDGTVTFPSVWYTGRLVSDPLGTMPQGEGVIHNGTGSQTAGGNRWGDYSSMNIDPVDDCTFWYVTEYVPVTSASGWQLRIGSFKFPSCSLAPDFSLAVTPSPVSICTPNNATFTVNVGSISGFNSPVTLSATGNPATTTTGFVPNPVPTLPGSSTLTIGNTAGAAAGAYTVNVQGTAAGPLTHNQNATLNVFTGSPGAPTLTAPANAATGQSVVPTFTWSAVAQALSYTLEIATDAGFGTIVHTSAPLATTTYSGATLNASTLYFWRVRAVNPCGNGSNSSTFQFTTLNTCQVGAPYTTSSAAGAIVPGVTNIGNACDDCVTNVVLPFPVVVYDQSFTSVNLDSNGKAGFISSASAFTNTCLPSAAANTTIFAQWDDLRTDAGTGCSIYPGSVCGIFTTTTGVAPNRVFHIEWRARYFSGTASANFALQLHEGTPNFELVYGTVTATGATTGVQRDAGSLFTQFSCNAAVANSTQVSYACAITPVELMGFNVE